MKITAEFERKLGMIKALRASVELEIRTNGNIALMIDGEFTVYNDMQLFEEYVDNKLHEVRNKI